MSDATVKPLFDQPIPPEGEFDFGRVLGRSLSAWSCNVLPFTAVAALVYSPILFYAFYALQGPPNLGRIESVDRWLLLGPMLLEPIVAGVIAKAVLRQHRGKPSGVLEAMGEAARQIVPLLGVTLLGGLLIAVGSIALLIPGLILYHTYWVAGPVAALERPGISASLSRSSELTSGHRLKIFGLVLIIGLVTYISNQILLSYARQGTTFEDIKLYIAIYYLITINIATIRAVMRASSYVELTGAGYSNSAGM